MLAQPADYGLTNALRNGLSIDALGDPLLTDKSLNGRGTNYIFWDNLHPTAVAQAGSPRKSSNSSRRCKSTRSPSAPMATIWGWPIFRLAGTGSWKAAQPWWTGRPWPASPPPMRPSQSLCRPPGRRGFTGCVFPSPGPGRSRPARRFLLRPPPRRGCLKHACSFKCTVHRGVTRMTGGWRIEPPLNLPVVICRT